MTSTTSREHPRLRQAVLAGGGVEHEQHLGHRRLLLDDALDLPELVHEAGLVLQPAGGVDDHDVDALREPGTDGLEGDAGGVAGLRAADHGDADALAPGGELLGRGGAEGVRRPQHDGAALGDEHARQLADRRGLAGAVDADDQHDAGPTGHGSGVQRAVHVGADQRQQLLAQHVAGDGVRALHAQPGPEVVDQLGGGGDADVGGEQGVLEVLPRLLVQPVPREQREQAAPERARAARAAGAAARAGWTPTRDARAWRRGRPPGPRRPPAGARVPTATAACRLAAPGGGSAASGRPGPRRGRRAGRGRGRQRR